MMRLITMAVFVSFVLIGCENSDAGRMNRKGRTVLKQGDKKEKKKKKEKSDKKKKGKKDNVSRHIAMLEQWDMPGVLTEISGIAWYGNDMIAAVQDEAGIVFIYDLRKRKIEKEIRFGGKGDYEGVAIAGDRIFTLRSDGTIIEIKGGAAKEYPTHLNVSHDTEGLAYDKRNNRLLVAVKAGDASSSTRKEIYGFDLAAMQMDKRPVMWVDLEHPLLSDGKKKMERRFQPSEIAVHPQTGDIYLADGTDPSLLIMDKDGEIKALYKLDRAGFKQPEGIAFSPSGEVFISSEGVKGKGIVAKVKINSEE